MDRRRPQGGARATGTAGTLTADVASATGTERDVALVDPDLPKADRAARGGVVTPADVPAEPTEAGSAGFSAPGGRGGCPAGTARDPVTASFSLDRDATPPRPPAAPPAPAAAAPPAVTAARPPRAPAARPVGPAPLRTSG
ncbi:hypothetical protein ACFUJU_10135 [Streptomyces sp. NPDC057235]|uniref:hypothetical protein n=1 Tax=Streptomyces sp. NPDC057235 TaxID=3346058 RepID=UPI00363E4746